MLGRLNARLCHLASLFLGALMLALTALILVNVTLRYGFGYTIQWTEEVTKYSLIWIIFIGGGVAAREVGHLSIELILSLMPVRLAQIHTVIVNVICAVVSVVVGVIGWDAVASSWEFGQRGSASGMPVYLVYLGLPLGCLMLALGFLGAAQKAAAGDIARLSAESFGS